MKAFAILATGFLALTVGGPGLAQTPSNGKDNPGSLPSFPERPAFLMKAAKQSKGAGAQVIGGVEATMSAWPASLKFNEGAQLCSATVVGPFTILTAAHCLADYSSGQIELGNVKVWATCYHHPEYDKKRFDIALCQARDELKLPNNAPYERVNDDQAVPALNKPVTLQGYGCTTANGDPVNTMVIGVAFVSSPAGQGATFQTSGGVVLCSGDSGGAGFVVSEARRRIVGVAAKSDEKKFSVLTAVADPRVRKFLTDWKSPICGATDQKISCRAS